MGTRYRGRYRAPYRSSRGQEFAQKHIEAAHRLSEELGGTDEDVKQYFFNLPEVDLRIVLDLYEHHYGRPAREYAVATIGRWRSGSRKMSGDVASRLFNLLPPVMPLHAKYQLITNLWNHVGPRSKKTLRVGLDANVEDAALAVRRHIDEVVIAHKVPDAMERRFNWLASGDSHVKQDLLNYLRGSERQLAEHAARTQLPVMLQHLQSHQGVSTHRLAQILKIGNHEVEILIDRNATGVSLIDPPRASSNATTRTGISWIWIFWISAALVLLVLIGKK
ncbi:MAG: hypothetical protein JWN71_4189 [Xanthobacteraceae bacterium]|nr:hypothetical protein [Xanthobacteraceae bacterium]